MNESSRLVFLLRTMDGFESRSRWSQFWSQLLVVSRCTSRSVTGAPDQPFSYVVGPRRTWGRVARNE